MPSLGQKGMGYFCMADFGTRWENQGAFKEGGQAHTFKVVDKDDPARPVRILKRLKNPKRSDRFDQEVQACLVLEHPNILPILDHGVLADGKPYFVTPFCNRGNLEEQQMPLGSPLEVLKSFQRFVKALPTDTARALFTAISNRKISLLTKTVSRSLATLESA